MSASRFDDLSGSVFGEWRAIKSTRSVRAGRIYHCKCSCGTEREILRSNLVSGKTRSCGCKKSKLIADKKTTHGQSAKKTSKPTKLYRTWASMKTRCENEKSKSYHNYGGRGIKICDEWSRSFENFAKDIGEPPSGVHSIDRIDPDGNYEPGNCRWADKKTQARNRRSVRLSEEIVNDLRLNKVSYSDVEAMTGCCKATVSAAKRGVNWQ